MDYVLFKKAVDAYRAYMEKGSGIDRAAFVERWKTIQSMQGIRCPR